MIGLDRPEAAGVLISCTALPAAAHVAEVEAKLGKPVVTSNLAAMWHALTISGIGTIRKGFGRLGATLHEQDWLSPARCHHPARLCGRRAPRHPAPGCQKGDLAQLGRLQREAARGPPRR